jgi:hypothetical protein
MERSIDIERLRGDLLDYFGSAMFSGFPMAMMDVMKIENASADTLIRIASENGFNLNKYL